MAEVLLLKNGGLRLLSTSRTGDVLGSNSGEVRSMFEVAKCKSCGAEIWLHSIEGKLVIDNGKLCITDGNHIIDVKAFINSLGIREGNKLRIFIEREDNNG